MALERLTTRINIEMTGETRQYLVSAKQGDKATRYVIAKLLNDGIAYTIPDGARVAFNVEKPDGKHVYNTCTYSGSEVTVELTNQTLAAAGTAYCDIEVRTSDNAQIITTASFTIEIERSMRSDGAIESSNEFTELEDRIAGHIKNITDTNDSVKKAETSRVTAETERETAERRRTEAETSRVTAETERETAERRRTEAETSRVTAETERETAERRRTEAETSRVTAETERETAEEKRQQNEQTRIDQETKRQEDAAREIKNMQDATEDAESIVRQASETIEDINNKLVSGYFIGPKGDKGDKGDKGERGESGIAVPTNGMFNLTGDEDGNLWAVFPDDVDPPQFETDEDGNIYMIVSDAEKEV